jgi:uncharacterized membrane protein YjdF
MRVTLRRATLEDAKPCGGYRVEGIEHVISIRTLTAAVGVIVLTVIHHLYGATLYDAPFRQHVAFGILPVLLVLILAYWVHRRSPLTSLGRVSLSVFMAVTLIVPVGMIGLFEGGYNHLVKNLLYFGGASRATLDQLFPPPAYENA